MSVTVVPADDLDVSRGDLICRAGRRAAGDAPAAGADLLDDRRRRCAPGRASGSSTRRRRVRATVESIDSRLDVAIAARGPRCPASWRSTTSGACTCSLSAPVMADRYDDNRVTGGFILIDETTRNTVAAGMVVRTYEDAGPAVRAALAEHRLARAGAAAAAALGHAGAARRDGVADRAAGVGQVHDRRGARAPARRRSGRPAYLLDGENVRHGLSSDLGFSRRRPPRARAARGAASRACSPTPGW